MHVTAHAQEQICCQAESTNLKGCSVKRQYCFLNEDCSELFRDVRRGLEKQLAAMHDATVRHRHSQAGPYARSEHSISPDTHCIAMKLCVPLKLPLLEGNADVESQSHT